jgi:hypothetical protein
MHATTGKQDIQFCLYFERLQHEGWKEKLAGHTVHLLSMLRTSQLCMT